MRERPDRDAIDSGGRDRGHGFQAYAAARLQRQLAAQARGVAVGHGSAQRVGREVVQQHNVHAVDLAHLSQLRRRVDFYWKSRAFDISRARAELGYNPAVSLQDGIRRTADWYRAQGLL